MATALGRQVLRATPVTGGCTPAVRLCIELDDGSTAFVKAANETHPPTAEWLNVERTVYDHVAGSFLPRVLAWVGGDAAPAVVMEDLSAAHWPPPWSEDLIARANAALDAVHAAAPPPDCRPAAFYRDSCLGWERVASDPEPFLGLEMVSSGWLDRSLPALREAARAFVFEGDDMLHFDVRSDNLCRRGDDVVFVDWNWVCVGNGDLDRGCWLPSLAAESGQRPEVLMPGKPECASLVAGYLASVAGLPDLPHAPKVRPLQRKQLNEALPWAVRALGLPAPDA